MTRYELTAPVIIGPRLAPAVIIGRDTDQYGTITAEIESFDEGPVAVIRYAIDIGEGASYEAADLRVRLFADDTATVIVTRGIATLLSFLEAAAEEYTGSGRMGTAEPIHGWLFDARVAEWAYLNSDEIGSLRLELAEILEEDI